MQKLMVEKFKSSIGIDKLKIADDNEGVVADWSSPLKWDIFKGQSWHAEPAITSSSDSEVISKIDIEKGTEIIRIDIIVSSSGNRPPLGYLIGIATSTTMIESPYSKAEGLGDLYINSIHESRRTLVWIYRNICFAIRHDFEEVKKPSIDTFTLAKWMQQYAEKHLVNNVSDYYPKIMRFEIKPDKIHMGDMVSIKLIMKGESGADNYKVGIKQAIDTLDYVRTEGLTEYLKAVKPGLDATTFTIYDNKTLLKSQKTVTINVLEKGKQE